VFLVEDVHFFVYLIVFLIVVVGFGVFYAILTPVGHGIGHNSSPIEETILGKSIYFSIVTLSSLGYGDMHPMGMSKVLACIEVLFGLGVMGIMIAKITSRRISYHVLRLFSSDAQMRLEELSAQFDNYQEELSDLMTELGHAYQATPIGAADNHKNKDDILERFRGVISELNSRSTALEKYISYELQQGNYFSVAPEAAVRRLGISVDQSLMILGQIIISLSPRARIEILDRKNRQHISEAIVSHRSVCVAVCQYSVDLDSKNIFKGIQETCNRIPEGYFAGPESLQPDQVLQGTDEPQEL